MVMFEKNLDKATAEKWAGLSNSPPRILLPRNCPIGLGEN
jgi:hypothetical protein